MNKVTVKIEGMTCGMCEAHICDTIRRAFPDAKRVKASGKKKEVTFLTVCQADREKIEKIISETGYTFISCESENYAKNGIFG